MTKWVYKVEKFGCYSETELEDRLNKLGEYGWELASTKETEFHTQYIFKMPDTELTIKEEDAAKVMAKAAEDIYNIAKNAPDNEMLPACQYCGDPKCYEVRTPEDVRALDKAILLPMCVDTYESPDNWLDR